MLVECAGHDDPTAALAAAVGDRPAAVAGPGEPARRAELWRYRETITESINRIGPPVKLDVTLPGPHWRPSPTRSRPCSRPGPRLWLFGHVADGNVHVNVTGVDPGDESVDDAVLRLVAAHGGSISAEHGIGRAKRPGCTSCVRRPSSPPCARSRRPSTRPASSTPTSCCSCRGEPASQRSSRRAGLEILPVPPLGSSSSTMTRLGALKRARRPWTHSISSSSVGFHAGVQRHERRRHLAPALVGHAHHGHLAHRRVGAQRGLDLDRRDVLAAGHDEVLPAVDDRHVAVGVDDGEVAGAEPPPRSAASVSSGRSQ